jgi:hypothetical protein
MNKREFVLATGVALATGGTWAATAPIAGQGAAPGQAVGSAAQWRSRLGERFDVFGALVPGHLVLMRVDEHAGDALTSQFSLVFEASDAASHAGTQVLQAGSGGSLALYLDRAGVAESGASLMRADFCQLG